MIPYISLARKTKIFRVVLRYESKIRAGINPIPVKVNSPFSSLASYAAMIELIGIFTVHNLCADLNPKPLEVWVV